MTTKKALAYSLIFAGSLFDELPDLIQDVQIDEMGFDERKLLKGISLSKDWPVGFTIYVSGTRLVDYFIAKAYYEVVSPAFRQVIEDGGRKDVEFLPVKMKNLESRLEIDGYSVMNVISVLDALNWENTIWITSTIPYNNPEAVLDMIKPALDLSKIIEHDVFKITINQEIRGDVYLSAAIKGKLLKAKAILGMEFMPIRVIDDTRCPGE